MANEQTTPGQVNPTVDPQTPATPLPPNDANVYQIPAVQEYLKTEAQLASLNKLRETEGATFVVQDPAAIAAENAIRASQAQQAAALQEQGILQVLQRDAAIEANTTAASQAPVGALADYYNQQDAAEAAAAAAAAANNPTTPTAQPNPNPPVNFFTGVPDGEPIDLYEGVDPGLDAAVAAAQARFDAAPTETAIDVDPQDPLALAAAEAAAANEAAPPTEQTVIDAEQDPFEQARLEAAQRTTDEQPTEADLNVGPEDPEVANLQEQAQEINRAQLAQEATDVEPDGTGYPEVPPLNAEQQAGTAADDGTTAGIEQQIAKTNAQLQSTRQSRQMPPKSADWRVRIQLAPNADYLYKEPPSRNGRESGAGILAPLAKTDGVVFPYTPTIETAYVAKYNSVDLTHSNYKGYFYQGSSVNDITVKGTFTAQDTAEAAYLLAVIHFFRSVTKMFYGQDQQRGTPPPLVYLSGFGQYQFENHPCVVANFSYTLPNDVDYIRAVGFNNYGVNMDNRRNQVSGPGLGGTLGSFIKQKLGLNGLSPGGLSRTPDPAQVSQNVNNTVASTYVPTKMEIAVTLHPMQTRNQVSKQFSLQSFANGDLIKGGFW